METCGHCGETFEDDDAYLSHLATAHEDDLTRLEQRKVEASSAGSVSSGLADRLPSSGFLVLVVILLFSAALVAFVSFGLGSGGSSDAAQTPTGVGSVHYHGGIDVTVEGERIDFSQSQYQLQADAFHFENGNGERWHVHARGVTLQWAMDTLGFNVTRNTVTFEGQTYRDSDPGTSVSVTVNGNAVDPPSYVLREGDTIEITVESGG
jgi:hypothetical protein